MEEKFLSSFRIALEKQGEVNMDDSFRDYEVWDSLSHLSLIAMLDSEYNLQIENAKFEKMKTVRDVFNFLQARASQ